MKCQQYISAIPSLIITFFVMLFGVVPPAYALDQISVDNLQAAMRTLSFLESLPKEGTIAVGVVYSSDIPTTQVLAVETAKAIGAIRGPNSRTLQPIVLSSNDLGKFEGHLDVVFLVMGSSKHPEVILDAIRRLRLMSVSDDPVCLDTKCCVLMVRTGQRVEISLNTALADAVGARFSLVFTMVVKRK
jgi:YfiR/HmsC-like